MNRQTWEISSLQAAMLVAGAVSLTGHALAVTLFMRAGGRDAWMSGLVTLPIAAIATWSVVRLGRLYPGQTIVQYLPRVLGYAGYLVAALYPLYYLTAVIFTLRMTTDWLVDSVLMDTPSWVLGLLYMLTVVYAASMGLDTIARINQFTLPLLSVLGMLVAVGTGPAKNYALLRPFLEDGLGPVMAVSFLGLGYYGETSILAMVTGYVRNREHKRLLKATLLALLFVALTLTGPLAGSVATLGYRVAQDMPYPTFTHWMMISLARFFERTDLLAVHQWLAGAYVRCALFLLMATQGMLQLAKSRSKPNKLLAGLTLVVVVGSELLFPTKPDFDAFIVRFYLPTSAHPAAPPADRLDQGAAPHHAGIGHPWGLITGCPAIWRATARCCWRPWAGSGA